MELKQENKDWIDAFMTTYPDGMSKSLARQTLESFIRKAVATSRADELKTLLKTFDELIELSAKQNDPKAIKIADINMLLGLINNRLSILQERKLNE